MKYFKLYTILAIIGVSVFQSCNKKTIDVLPIGNTESSYFQDEKQIEEAVFGIYQKLAFFYAFRGGTFNNVHPVTLLPSDDLTTTITFDLENFSGLNGGNGQLNLYYTFAYQLIARANTVIEKIDENKATAYQKDPKLADYHKGEALFLRGYMFFNLWNVFGTVPVVTKRIVNLADAYPPSTKGTELLDQAIEDMEQAKALLPDSWAAAFKGRVTKNSARGLKSKCLVFRGTVNKTQADFTSAIGEINSLSGLKLAANYNQNFDVKFENNEESLFEYQANTSPGPVNPFVGGSGGNDAFSIIGEIGAYWGIFSQRPSWIGNAYYTATPSIRNAFDPGDPRLQYILKPESAGPINVIKYTRNTNYATGGNGSVNEVSVNNPRILRYADILLLKAEALVRSGGDLQEAVTLINQIRQRARNSVESGAPSLVPADRNTNESNRGLILEWIFQERRLELAFEEGHRWWDLRRRHIAKEIDLKNLDFQSKLANFKFEDKHIYFPIPEVEVVENPNLDQNPGY